MNNPFAEKPSLADLCDHFADAHIVGGVMGAVKFLENLRENGSAKISDGDTTYNLAEKQLY